MLREIGLSRYQHDFRIFIRWYLNTFLIVGAISLYLAFAIISEFSPSILGWWTESAAATILVSVVPSLVIWVIVFRGLAMIGWSRMIREVLAGTITTGAAILAMIIAADVGLLPSWFVFALNSALIMGMIPAIIVGPITAFILARKSSRQHTSSGSVEPKQ
ncbi:hypothetical protein [Paracoccus saliphilus]|uniref:Uncharacterized protein n=1 Tax=Paracoccus saliphilus TaxID=405559 RepID=A0ABY7S3L2_9RHOB|nr:hypothetical protein [Paracoccus saliphilus]WCR01650.1 hypothetical protein JHX88_11970 [Paracoccus saliphilus]